MTIQARKLSEIYFENFQLPPDCKPFLSEEPLFHENTADAYSLLHSTYPFNKRSGRMKRTIDIPLVKRFYREHCPRNFPTKVKVSYQKLLKKWVLNELHKKGAAAKNEAFVAKVIEDDKIFPDYNFGLGRSRFTGLSTRP